MRVRRRLRHDRGLSRQIWPSIRVQGLDWSNSNAHARAIVIHPAWYAEQSHLSTHGLLGRSEGCFAMSQHQHA
jgi:hypothetical protein